MGLFFLFYIIRTRANRHLTKEKPNGNLFSYEIILSITLQVLVVFFFQYYSYKTLRSKSWFVELPPSNNPLFENPNNENTVNIFFNLCLFITYIVHFIFFNNIIIIRLSTLFHLDNIFSLLRLFRK